MPSKSRHNFQGGQSKLAHTHKSVTLTVYEDHETMKFKQNKNPKRGSRSKWVNAALNECAITKLSRLRMD